jgi:hypothetical protein
VIKERGWYIVSILSRLILFLTICYIAFAMFLPIVAQAESDCREEIKIFLATPDERALQSISGAKNQKCWDIIRHSDNDLNGLLRSVERGNPWSAQYLVEHLKELDGGNLEDSLVALGKFSMSGNNGMEQLMYFRKNGQISNILFSNALTMLSLELSDNLTDNPCGQLNELQARKKRILKIKQKNLANEKFIAIKAIDHFILEIKANTPNQAWRGSAGKCDNSFIK